MIETVTILMAVGNDYLMVIRITLLWSEYVCLPIICITFAFLIAVLKENQKSFIGLSKTGISLLCINSITNVAYVTSSSLIFKSWKIGYIIGMVVILA